MSTAAKALILTWVAIGFLIVGAAGFYLGRTTAPKIQLPSGMQPPSGMMEKGQQPGQQFGPGGMMPGGQPPAHSPQPQ